MKHWNDLAQKNVSFKGFLIKETDMHLHKDRLFHTLALTSTYCVLSMEFYYDEYNRS